jgi:putative Mg2+ transporter-C (MgtC) family protein
MYEVLAAIRETVMPLVSAVVLGGAIGWERETWQKPAGLRTHMMVALGASAFTLLTVRSVAQFGGSVDPSRIIVGVAPGIGFLGAGTIIQSPNRVRGITTAAGVWVVGAVGACCGAGQYLIAGITVALSLVILGVLTALEPEARGSRTDPES